MIVRRTLCTDPPFMEYTIIYEFASSGRTIAYHARASGNYSPTIAHASPVACGVDPQREDQLASRRHSARLGPHAAGRDPGRPRIRRRPVF